MPVYIFTKSRLYGGKKYFLENDMAESLNAFDMAQQQFDSVAKKLNLDPGVIGALRWPMREFTFRIPVRMDNAVF